MSDSINIKDTSYINYRTDILTDYGAGKYYIRNSDFDNIFSCSYYDIGCTKEWCNPIVTDKLVAFGNFYYTELLFENPALSLSRSITVDYESFYIYNRINMEYDSSGIILQWSGFFYNNGNWEDIIDRSVFWIRFSSLPLNVYNDIDFTKGFYIHLCYDNTRTIYGQSSVPTVRERFYNIIESRNFINSIDRNETPGYYNYANEHLRTGFALLSTSYSDSYNSWEGEIRVSYIDHSGNPKDFYRQHYFSIYSSLNILTPSSLNETIASECANSKWSSGDISLIQEYMRGR